MAGDPLEQYVKKNMMHADTDPLAAYVAKNQEPKKEESSGRAFSESVANAATLGYMPQIYAGTTRGGVKLYDLIKGTNLADATPSYTELRDEKLREGESRAKEHPVANLAGTVAGIVGPGMLAPVVRGGTALARIASGAKIGGAYGLLANPGDVEGEVGAQPTERLKRGALGALTGGLTQGVLEGASKVAGSLKGRAEEKAFKASGAMLKDFRKAEGSEKINELGRLMLDKGMVKPGASYDDIAHAASQVKAESGSKIGDLISELGLQESLAGAKNLPREKIAGNLRERLIEKSPVEGTESTQKLYETLINKFQSGEENMGIQSANDMRLKVKELINWKRLPTDDIPPKERYYRALYDELKGGLEGQTDEVASMVGKSSDYRGLKSEYGGSKTIEKIATDRALREKANRFFSPSDYLSGGLGAAGGFASGGDIESKLKNAAVGASIGLANKAARSYGPGLQATGYDAMSRAISKASTAGSANPMLAQVIPQSIAEKITGMGKFEKDSSAASDPKVIDFFKSNPQLLENVQDPKIRANIERKISSKPATAVQRRLQK